MNSCITLMSIPEYRFSPTLPKNSRLRSTQAADGLRKQRLIIVGKWLAFVRMGVLRRVMTLHLDDFGEVVIVECEGRIVGSDAVFALRNAVTSRPDARVVILDFSEVDALGGGGIGMLAFLQGWARSRGTRLKLFNPSRSLLLKLEQIYSLPAFELATVDEVLAYLSRTNGPARMTSTC
jgi:anti-anti-sigma regulatory factor